MHKFRKPKRRKRRKSLILTRCEELMEALWEDGYRKQVPRHTLRDYVIAMIGGFRTTVTDYMGKRAKYYHSRGRKGILKSSAKKGYLEKFGFVEKFSPKLVNLHHKRVDRSYHSLQTNIVNFSLSNSVEANARTIGAIAPTDYYTTTTYTKRERKSTINTNNTKPTLTPEELRILKASRRGF